MNEQKIPLAGVIGHPIAHSRSPQLHGHWLRKNGIKGHYIPLDIAPEDLERTIAILPKMGFVGINVTLPHKESVLELADLVTDRANLIGAANTLIFRKDGKIHADNTDGYGFMQNLLQSAPKWNPTAGPAIVLGAGGAARAVLASLIGVGVPEILLTNRTRERAEQLKQDFGDKITVVDWVQAGNAMEGVNAVINTTSLGMLGKPEMRVPLDALAPGMLVSDLVYTPLQTKLLRAATEAGATAVDGLGMLLHQAAPGFERWFKVKPIVDDELRAVVLR